MKPIFIVLTFLGSFMLTLLPLPEWALWLRPAWVVLVLIYWIIALPYTVGVGTAWFLGLLLDVLNGALLGEHALAMTIVAYATLKMHARIKMFSLLQQGLCVLWLVLLYQFIVYCIQGFLGHLPNSIFYWASSIVSMLLWPWIVSILKPLRRYVGTG